VLLIILIGLIAAAVAATIHRIDNNRAGIWLSILPLGIFIWGIAHLNSVLLNNSIIEVYPWVDSIGLSLTFMLDGLSLFFVLLVSGVGFFIFIYANSYLHNDPNKGKFLTYLSLFMTAMLGIVMSGNLLILFIFWELTSLSSYLLIGFYSAEEESRKSALMAMLVTVSGGLFMLAGIILLGIEAGTLELDQLLANPTLLVNNAKAPIIAVLIMIGALTKSAQFPFHFWLPNAMAAPAPVSAYLHSTTMVKAGVFLLARLSPVFVNVPIWQSVLVHIGGITMVFGALMALMNTDMKKVLAYTTISALGIMVLLLGIGTTISVQAAMVFLLAHALYKGTLFMVTGNVDHETGMRDLNLLSGLGKRMPYTFYAGALAALSMAGVIPFFGFVAKEILYGAAFDTPLVSGIVGVATFLTGVMFTALAFEFGYKIFMGMQAETPKHPHEAPFGMILGPIVLATFGLIGGIFSEQIAQPLLHQSSSVILNVDKVLQLGLWHGFTLIFALSLLTLLFGYGVFKVRQHIRAFSTKLSLSNLPGPEALYFKSIPALLQVAKKQTMFFQSGILRNYLTTIVLTLVSLIVAISIIGGDFSVIGLSKTIQVKWFEVVFIVLMIVGVVNTLTTTSRLTAIVSLGVVGYGTAAIFLYYGGPDVAMTQFLIETLTIVLFVLVLNRLPKFVDMDKRLSKRIAFPSVIFGATMSTILLWVLSQQMNSPLKDYYSQSSYLLAKGKNVVNVILVDFRGIDTLGEITVLGIAAIGIYALLKVKFSKS
jgi:multicomponent Na+:H+ antiporter subunit A